MSRIRFNSGIPACLALTALAFVTPVQAQGRSGELGGGFIEFLMTGSNPAPRQGAPAYAPTRSAPLHSGSTRQVAYAEPPTSRSYRSDDPLDGQPVLPARGPQQTHTPNPVEGTFDPRFEKQEVAYDRGHAPGTIVIDTPNRFLYLVQGNGRALRYGIGVGRPGFEWAGAKTITRKAEWPDWRPPAQMLKRRPDLPPFMAGGPDNPLGARALYLGSSLYRIHGTNEPNTIGQAVSSGCIRMRNEDVMDLYTRVRVGTRVVVI